MYIVEISPSDLRGAYGVIHQLMITLGISYIYFLGIFFRWRLITFLCLAPVIILGASIWILPKTSLDKEEIDFHAIEHIFKSRFIKPFIVSFSLILFQQFSGINPILTNLDLIFSKAGLKLNSSLCSLIIGIAQIIATLLASYCIEILGRRPIWIISSIGQALALYVMWIRKNWHLKPIITLLALFIYVFSYGLAFGPVPWMIVPELFPNSVRSIAVSLTTGVNWILSTLTIFIWKPIVYAIGEAWGYFIFGCFCVGACAFGFFVMPETKGKEIGELSCSM